MGAQSDFISEQFVPSESYKAQQLAMAEELLACGVDREILNEMFLVTFENSLKTDEGDQ